MSVRFETSHIGDVVVLTLLDSSNLAIWRIEMERFRAQLLIDMLRRADSHDTLHVGDYRINICEHETGQGKVIYIGDSSPYMKYKVLLSIAQVSDLCSTLQMHIFASEEQGRPKDILAPLDDTIAQEWNPDKEKQMFGNDDLDDYDSADDWKRKEK